MKVLYDKKTIFEVLAESEYGENIRKAAAEAIRTCKEENVLKEFLEENENDVLNIIEESYIQKAIFEMLAEDECSESD